MYEGSTTSKLRTSTSSAALTITKRWNHPNILFFKAVQNKLHCAISGRTAADLIVQRADASEPNMGLKTWKNAPEGKILKGDITVAKNYLEENEIKALERVVTMYLD